ncbi:hypothetical protein SAMN05444162_0153 [Paenibacillaceae bacterium GAS479]|nr:hypothetical protein SAMN05444162_0153 [Paenibacillaceae bacterium GAS479]
MQTCKSIESELNEQGIDIGDLDFEIAKIEAELNIYLGSEASRNG